MDRSGREAAEAVWGAVIVAAGGSSRYGGRVPKQFLPLDGVPVVEHSLRTVLSMERVSRVVLVVPAEYDWRRHWTPPAIDRLLVRPGGSVRGQSVLAGLDALGSVTHAAVHDAARPLASAALFHRVMDAAELRGAAVPLYPVASTVKRVSPDGMSVENTVDRGRLRLSQTPQAAGLDLLERALRALPGCTDEAAALERAGVEVAAVEGERENIKLTRPGDMRLLEAFLPRTETALGTGLDFHPLVEGRPMVACGVHLDDPVGPAGHSDGDAALHAAADAVLSAARLGDIGQLFPPGDPAWKDADSRTLLRRAVDAAAGKGWRVLSADLTLMGERPRVLEAREEMVAALAEALGCRPCRVWVKGTTTNGLGPLGRGEAMGALALVRLTRRAPDGPLP